MANAEKLNAGYAWWFPRLAMLFVFGLLMATAWKNCLKDPYGKRYREDKSHIEVIEKFIAEKVLVADAKGLVKTDRTAFMKLYQKQSPVGEAYVWAQANLDDLKLENDILTYTKGKAPVNLSLLIKYELIVMNEDNQLIMDQSTFEDRALRSSSGRRFVQVHRNLDHFRIEENEIRWDPFYFREMNNFKVAPALPRGNIYDRRSKPLANWKDSRRQYADDSEAVFHLVGRQNRFGLERKLEKVIQGQRDHGWFEYLGLWGHDRKGDDFKISVDVELNKRIFNAFEHEKKGRLKGGAVVLDVKTGRILAAVSSPAPDLKRWRSLTGHQDKPLNNRAFDEIYFPGSTYKVVVGTAMLRYPNEENERLDVRSDPFEKVKDKLRFAKVRNHGGKVSKEPIDITMAMATSSNTYFAIRGCVLGEKVQETAELLGFNQRYDLLEGIEGHEPWFPETPLAYRGEPFIYDRRDFGLIAQFSIGQNQIKSHPLHMASIAQMIANDGIYRQPSLVIAQRRGGFAREGDWPAHPFKEVPASEGQQLLEAEILRPLKDAMWAVSNVKKGTGYYAPQVWKVEKDGEVSYVCAKRWAKPRKGELIEMAGKTGTAQDGKRKPHAWFIGFAPYDNPRFAVAVAVENVGYGSTYAIPIASEALRSAFELIPDITKKENE